MRQSISAQYQSFGCLEDVLTLNCTNCGNITVERAYYGQWKQETSCPSGSCCAPNPGMDCFEVVSIFINRNNEYENRYV